MSTVDYSREPRWLSAARAMARLVLRVVFRLRVHGAEHLPAHGPVLLAGNHTGFLDGPIVFIVLDRPSVFLAKSELYVGAVGRGLRLLRQQPVRRGRPDRTALRVGLQVLADGGVLGMFPEGTRGSGDLETVQHGVGYIALKSAAPVVPVVCLGTGDALPKGARLPRWRAPVDIVFGPPVQVRVDTDPRSRRAVAAAAEQVRLALREHLAAANRATGRAGSQPSRRR